MKKLFVLAALLLGVTSFGIGTAEAGRPSISVLDGVFGGTTIATANPGGDTMVKAQCYQNGTLVYVEYAGLDANNQAVLTLGPTTLWTGGDADCTASKGYFGNSGRWRSVASTTFYVDG